MKKPYLGLLFAFLFLLGSAYNVKAQILQDAPEAASSQNAGWSARIDGVAEQLGKPDLSDEILSRLRDELEAVRGEARKWIAEQAPALEIAQKELEALGPPPGEGEEPEAAGVATQRKDLNIRLADITGPIKEAELTLGRANRLISEIGGLRRKRFADRTVARGPLPLSPAVWRSALPEMTAISNSIFRSAQQFVGAPEFQEKLRESVVALLIAVIFAIILVWPVHRWLLRRYGRDPAVARPSFMRALRATVVVGAARALLPTAAAALIYIVVVSEGLLTEAGEEIGEAVFIGIVLFTWTVAFFRASLSPMQPNWRIVPVPTNFARSVRGIVIGLALAFAVDIVLSEVIVTYSARLAITALRDYVLTVVVTILLLLLLLRQQMWIPEDDPSGKPSWRFLRILIAVGLLALLALGAFGYVALARLAVTQLVLTGGLVLLMLILHRLGREFIRHAISLETWIGERLRASLRMDEASTIRFEFWAGLAYDALLVLLALVIGLFVWGADRKDVADWMYQVLFGFEIGQFSFSLVDLVIAVALFAGLLMATRFIQRTLSEQILPQTQLDSGIRQSIRTATGYVGIVIAAAVGISALGLDLSNLAIVAGALSVGIGFGLQNVVNNFVSGLILLVERPVKVGDWVVVGDKQGYVKRIKVRATEILTFDRATVFIPNSQLISDAVTNWTYADKLGRVIVPVGVAYGSNTRQVRETLLEIGRAHPEVMSQPGPSAEFRGFGDSALNFELRCFLENVERTIGVTTDLCIAIDEAFREKGIEIPFPQQDVYVKQLVSKAPLESGSTAPEAEPESSS